MTIITEPCGCENEVSVEAFGALHCIKKCEFHTTFALAHPEDTPQHYIDMGCLQNGIPQNKRYIEELAEPLKELNAIGFIKMPPVSARMLEIGCGLGMYVPLFLAYGWNYFGIDMAEYAVHWTANTFAVQTKKQNFEFNEYEGGHYDLIFGAHLFEHLRNAPAGFAKCFRALPSGGMLIMIIPDDTDKANPDHYWFFNKDNLMQTLEMTGFVNVRATVRKRVEYENFIYCVAEKA